MKIGIIGAMDEEVEILLREIKLQKKVFKAKMEFNHGILWGQEVVVVRSGIGKVNAAVCTQILIDNFNADCIINVGIAGGIGKDIYPGDVVVAESLVQHDMDTSAFGDKIGQIPRLDTFDFKCDSDLVAKAKKACEFLKEGNSFTGIIATGDQFIAHVDKIRWINEEFSAIACEMEGGSIAQVCYLNNIPFVVIRSISDNANNGAHMDFEKFKYIAVENSVRILKNMLESF
ncbi:5'-methylthioadenosine/adenosylhomocysteine nucleosidase [Clostridium sp. SYSU_GA19001]|uniref:5'-methylthioadenosine/adenosylhomocysteine nucleosidase n=1 Tax=Clostridium caldaquaticum TaxID=2940653 RepID=UPI0020777FFF|nr:5'-methylthioadenosine/adenosylhomocysteine nucleosidase [Clostridium caldaquaticum]MCM8711017.1 5'-methylthioadenosine/adenosylhomocysteine nucleosidase [Clostridium caldaquaticum]